MRELGQCSQCDGFVPRGVEVCPHCDVVFTHVAQRSGLAANVGKAVVGGSLWLALSGCPFEQTAVAVYGAPIACEDMNSPDCSSDVTCQPDEVDVDQDGFCGEYDCDDNDPEVHAMAEDTPNDGIDQDCDGEDAQ